MAKKEKAQQAINSTENCCKSMTLSLRLASDLSTLFLPEVVAYLYIPHSQSDATRCQGFYNRSKEEQSDHIYILKSPFGS